MLETDAGDIRRLNNEMKIRRMLETDAGDLLEVLGDPEIMTYIEPPSRKNLSQGRLRWAKRP